MSRLAKGQRLRQTEYFWLFILGLFAVDFQSCGSYFLVLLLAGYLLLHVRMIKVSYTMVALIMFSALYFVFYLIHYTPKVAEIFNYLIAPWAAYAFGGIFSRSSSKEKMPYYIIATVVLGLFLHGALNVLAYFVNVGMHLNSRVAYDFWRWEIISVTANGLYYQMAVGMAFGFLFSDFRKEAKLLAFLILGISGVNATLLGHRTALYIVVILLIYNMTVTLIKAEIPARRKRRVVFAGFAMSALAAILIATDFRGLRTWIVESHLFQRMTNADAVHSTDRALIWKSFFEKALYYPFGGSAYPLADMQRWVHNLWLDVYYKVGVIPCLALVLVTVAIFRQYRMVCRRYKRTGNNRAATVLTNIYLAFALNCMVEPVIDANPYVLISFFIVAGCVSGILRREQVAA